jgi:hypothetical protein
MVMSAGQVLAAAWHAMAGVNGEISLAIEKKQPVSKAAVLRWVKRLRNAADVLEALLK